MPSVYIPKRLRQRIYQMSEGRCEYCLMPESLSFAPHEIDHIIAQKHGGETIADNLALSCTLCNKHKGSDIASIDRETGDLTPLYHPRRDQWNDHFQIVEGRIMPVSPTGRVTAQLLQLNAPDRLAERTLLIKAGLYISS